jgi:hypothetical protein
MTTPETAAAALTRFDRAFAALDKTVKTLSERDLTERRDPAGWSAKDHLMHLAVWEQALLAKLDGRARHEALGLDASTNGSEDWDALNAQIFADTRHQPVGDVLKSLRDTHATTRTHLLSMSQGQALSPTADAFLADVPSYADHYDQHHGWIKDLLR